MIESSDTIVAGTVTGIEDHGTVVVVRLEMDRGVQTFVPFDHSPFRWLLEGEGVLADDLIGRKIAFDGQAVWFVAD